jgi:hypothetical protein
LLHCSHPQGAAGGKRVAKKILAKSGDAAFQYEILKADLSSWWLLKMAFLWHSNDI